MRESYRELTLAIEDQHWWYRGRRRIVREVLGSLPLPHPARLLDAGCGGGANLEPLAGLGSVTGLEPSEAALVVARRREIGEVVAGRIERMPFEDESFDVATSLDVLEHLDDDRLAFRELRRVVKRGGYLLVTVPAYPRLWSPHDVANQHRRRYVRRTLVSAAEATGWRPCRITFFNSILLPLIAARRLWQRARRSGGVEPVSDFELTPPWLNGPLEVPMRVEARVIASGRNLFAGLSLLGLFKAGAPSAS
jgi:SAM-dependent methyltransferase